MTTETLIDEMIEGVNQYGKKENEFWNIHFKVESMPRNIFKIYM